MKSSVLCKPDPAEGAAAAAREPPARPSRRRARTQQQQRARRAAVGGAPVGGAGGGVASSRRLELDVSLPYVTRIVGGLGFPERRTFSLKKGRPNRASFSLHGFTSRPSFSLDGLGAGLCRPLTWVTGTVSGSAANRSSAGAAAATDFFLVFLARERF